MRENKKCESSGLKSPDYEVKIENSLIFVELIKLDFLYMDATLLS